MTDKIKKLSQDVELDALKSSLMDHKAMLFKRASMGQFSWNLYWKMVENIEHKVMLLRKYGLCTDCKAPIDESKTCVRCGVKSDS